ncbi:LamG-like jellyroll fold domain-containing protein [Mangrovimonas sp. YM274]|uniref:LamG-like jellyroll fold domain-containing protein n=1 Tax=Mangrovimonas sp. YM274 TaxID=3070660 RepID=UPI0027DCCA65|nr:LamG-like jellyroll fold domain-containing protein [Mangrovimonas sp. YM274]WMI70221.1 LamG-like jellyroll fold domain-containing protein [Mangrovimonas sp. YM274]
MIIKLHKKMFFTVCFMVSVLTFNAQSALNFDKVNDYIQTPYAGVLGSANRTFEAWIYVPSSAPASNLAILDYGYSQVGGRNTFVVGGDRSLKFIAGAANVSTDADTVPLDIWVHVAFVKNGTTGYLYINGDEMGFASVTALNTPSWGDDVKIGERVAGGSILFQGNIDEVRIWDIARTEAEIQSTMNTGVCEDAAGLQAYFKLDEGIAEGDNTGVTTAVDAANGNNGTLMGFDLSPGTVSNYVGGHGLVTQEGATLTAAQTGATYQWVDCDNANTAIAGATEQVYTPEVSGSFAVEVTVDGCTVTSECVEVASLGVEDTLFASNLKLYPNPTSGNVNVTLNGVYQTVDAQLVSITGKVVATYQFSNTNEFSLDLNKFNSGLYFLNLKADQLDAATVKVVKM